MAGSGGAPTLAWSIPNMITITLMVLIVFAVVGFIVRAFQGATVKGAEAAPDAAASA